MEFEDVSQIEQATRGGRSELFRLGTALLFVVGIMAALLYYMIRGMMLP